MLKRQITQFDNGRQHATVATPTCSSCCCCCCCLTTVLTSSTILGRRINYEANKKKIRDPIGLTALATFFLPVIGGITYLLVFLINKDFGSCTTQTFHYSFSPSISYTSCSNPASNLWAIVPISVAVMFCVLAYLYLRVRMPKPWLRAVVVTAIIVAAFTAEFIGGAILILTGIGVPIYLGLVVVLFGVVQRYYSRNVMHQTITGNKIAST